MSSDNDEFRSLMFSAAAEDMDRIIDQVVDLEGQARFAGIVDQNPEEAGRLANLAHSVFGDVPLKAYPTLVMGLADRVNIEREMVMEGLEVLHSANGLLRLMLADVGARFPGDRVTEATEDIARVLDEFLNAHPYQRVPE